MAEGKIASMRFKVVDVSCAGNGASGMHTFDIPNQTGYSPIGIVGQYASGGFEASRGIYELSIGSDGKLRIGWESAVPENKRLFVQILYAST